MTANRRTGAGLRAGDACRPAGRRRLRAARAAEITSYLAQSTDLAREFAEIADGMRRDAASAFAPVALDDAAASSRRPRSGPHAGVDADRRHRLFPRRRRTRAGPAERPDDHRLGRFAVRALPGQVPLRRGARRARPAVAAVRAGARRRVAGRAAGLRLPAGSSSRTGSVARSASGRIRTAATSAMRSSSAAASSRLSRRRRGAALCRRAAMCAPASWPSSRTPGSRALGIALRRFRRRFPDHGRQPGALRRDRRGGEGEGRYDEPELVAGRGAQPAAAASDPAHRRPC